MLTYFMNGRRLNCHVRGPVTVCFVLPGGAPYRDITLYPKNVYLFILLITLSKITALPCKMHNFFILLKLCCIPPNVGGSEKKPL